LTWEKFFRAADATVLERMFPNGTIKRVSFRLIPALAYKGTISGGTKKNWGL
jgi:hypothetical protein